MKAYHFIKYNETTSFDKLIANSDSNTTLCFDFEDSIQDCLNSDNTSTLKRNYRNYFKTIIDNCVVDNREINIGIRINAIDSPEYLLDLVAIADLKHIATIFLPKINSPEQIFSLQIDLRRIGVNCNEIIPVVETKIGMDNLENILKSNSSKINSIAFGHCDYNFDNQIYPFFHQDSREYWTWITKIFEFVKPYNLSLVNSPFLQLDKDDYFKNMLVVLSGICGNNFAQITLTLNQTKLCNSFSENKAISISPKLVNRLDLKVPDSYAKNFIKSFKKNGVDKGFSISDNRTVLSPQEYRSSLNYLKKANFPEINFTFVGGCFPVQGNLRFENLFHQLLKRKIENSREIKFNVNIIRYERFRNCLSKIAVYKETKPIDILVFSIRPEPFLRLVKLYYKFLDSTTGKKRGSLNLPFFNKINPEKFDLLSLDTRFNATVTNDASIIRKTLINLNYILGALLGNDTYSLREYLKLINELIEFTEKNNINLLIMGPPIRTNTIIEKLLSKKLDRFMRKSLVISKDNFISGADLNKDGEKLFKKNGIYANEKYHDLIAQRMIKKIVSTINKIEASKSISPKTGRTLEYKH